MTATVKSAIDNKIDQLGREGCKRFLVETGQYWELSGLFHRDWRRAIRSCLAAENWSALNDLFLSWN